MSLKPQPPPPPSTPIASHTCTFSHCYRKNTLSKRNNANVPKRQEGSVNTCASKGFLCRKSDPNTYQVAPRLQPPSPPWCHNDTNCYTLGLRKNVTTRDTIMNICHADPQSILRFSYYHPPTTQTNYLSSLISNAVGLIVGNHNSRLP